MAAHNRTGMEKIIADVVEKAFPDSVQFPGRFALSIRKGVMTIFPFPYKYAASFSVDCKTLRKLMNHDIPGAYEYVETQIAISRIMQ